VFCLGGGVKGTLSYLWCIRAHNRPQYIAYHPRLDIIPLISPLYPSLAIAPVPVSLTPSVTLVRNCNHHICTPKFADWRGAVLLTAAAVRGGAWLRLLSNSDAEDANESSLLFLLFGSSVWRTMRSASRLCW
jgi:hypothetical protein